MPLIIVYLDANRISNTIMKYDTINNRSFNSTLKYFHDIYIALINRFAEKLSDFARLVLDSKSLSKAESIRIEIHNSLPYYFAIPIMKVDLCRSYKTKTLIFI